MNILFAWFHNQNHQLMASLAISLLSFSLSSLFLFSIAVDTISTDQVIRDGDTIISSSDSFELGFFSPGNSQSRYLGIWYKKVGSGTVVWVANREVSVEDKSGSFRFDGRGALVVLNQDNSTIWSSNTSRSASGNLVSQLLESGNLVIFNDQDPRNYLWQSFDHPGDTFLSGMKVGVSEGGRNWILTAWNSADDPSSSSYTFELDESGLQLEIKQNSSVVARTGIWNGVTFNGLSYLKPNSIFTYQFVYTPKEKYYTYQLEEGSVLSRVVLNQEGVLQRLTWNEVSQRWNIILTIPVDHCDSYSLCGPYGICDISNTPVCGCLKGFEPKNPNGWETTDWSSGCVRKTELDCEKGDGFRQFSNVRLPDLQNYTRNASMTLEECRVMCMRNCSCMGYANSNVTGGGSGCILWFGDLVDMKQFKDFGQDVYIRMAASETVEYDRKKKRKIIFSSTLSIGLALLILGLCLVLWRKRSRLLRPRKLQENNIEEDYSVDEQAQTDLDIPQFDFEIIVKATNNFSTKNLLGMGGFGHVYKGVLEGGKEVAVKRLSKESRQGQDEFKNEVKIIAKLQHRNLVKLLGFSIDREEKMLIYEYMPNKSLDCYIFDQKETIPLNWPRRFHIINGIARGLLYLHQDSRLRIIHRDLKVSNILLDNELNPKISDFGMARIFGGNETEANTKRVVGTYGYMSPEYAIDGLFSVKSDVFSFGVLVLEIVSGRRNRGFNHPDHQFNLLGHAWRLFKEARCIEFIDESIVESDHLSQILRSIHIGLLCVQHDPDDRPKMSKVVLMLNGEGKLPEPNMPGFFQKRKVIEGDTSSSNQELYSIDEATITCLEPR